MNFVIYFCEYEDMDYDGPNNMPKQKTIIAAESEAEAIIQLHKNVGHVRILEIVLAPE